MISLSKSNVYFCRWFEPYGRFCSIFFCTSLTRMRGSVFYELLDHSNYYLLCQSSFGTKATITLFYWQLESSFNPEIFLCHYESEHNVYWQLHGNFLIKIFLFVFIIKILSNKYLKKIPAVISYSLFLSFF